MRRWKREFIGTNGKLIQMEVKLTLRGYLILNMAHFMAFFFGWLPPLENFKAALSDHYIIRLDGGPWIRWKRMRHHADHQ